ncbi:MAG: T9SS type A sorting domain-containing protein [Chitinophagales bacterium]|nr:T9SS type A sorting domain-containing protein [Chitinophagaceae bacterium]MCB9063623.1 T9SS type A sorting domain-containing protein [Chitinophagales bacterium]
MKKLLLFVVGGALSLGAYAQQNIAPKGVPFVNGDKYQARVPVQDYKIVNADKAGDYMKNRAAGKNTGPGGSRWYDHFYTVSEFFGKAFDNSANTAVLPIWFDSTIRQRFSTGLGTINYLSISQNIDPIRSNMYNDATLYPGEIQVKNFNTYTVDSVAIRGAYVREKGRPSSVVDTLIFSVIPQDGITWFIAKSNANYGSKISNYTSDDTLWANAPVNVDSVNRAAFAPSSMTRRFWKVPLTATDGDTPNTTNNTVSVRTYVFPVMDGSSASPLSIPANNMFALTCTFKSGDTWAANVDSVTSRHRFMPITGQVSPGNAMPYIRKSPNNDRSMSGLMFSGDTSRYVPSVNIEIYNDNNFSREFHNFSAFVKCSDCDIVGVNNIDNVISGIDAYPNPAVNELYVRFAVKEATDVKVTLMNNVGQVVNAQTVNNVVKGQATFNVSNLSAGLYFYTVEANGQRETGRVAISH